MYATSLGFGKISLFGQGMRFRIFSAIVAALVLAWGQAAFAQAAPDWVEPAPLPEMKPAHLGYAEDGIYYLISDIQTRWQGTQRESYFRLARKVLNRTGLESAATVLHEYDPAHEGYRLLSLDIIRDGERIELAGQLTPDSYRREEGLEAGIVDGTLTVHYEVPGLQVGDIVDASAIWTDDGLLPGDTFVIGKQMGYIVPLGLNRLRLLWPADKPIFHSVLPSGVDMSKTARGEVTEYIWQRGDDAPAVTERFAPEEFDFFPEIRVSGYPDWEAVAHTLDEYYTAPLPLPPSLASRVDEIRASHNSPAGRVTAALRLVQDNIRYVGVEVGIGGYIARPPAKVVANGYGDCKDKALLLKTVLQALDIEAVVALALLDGGYGLTDQIPSVHAFDHMIVGARINGKMHWMDPTRSYQGGLIGQAAEPDYGWVLPLTEGEDDLVQIGFAHGHSDQILTTETLRFTALGLYLSVETEYRGASADWQRARWDTNGHRKIGKRYLEYYQGRYPGIQQMRDLRVSDNRAENLFTSNELYHLPPDALAKESLFTDFPFGSEDYLSGYPTTLFVDRRAPMGFAHPIKRKHVIRVHNAPINFIPPDDIKISNPAFSYGFSGTSNDTGNMTLTWSYHSNARKVSAGEVAEVLADIETLRDNITLFWDLTP